MHKIPAAAVFTPGRIFFASDRSHFCVGWILFLRRMDRIFGPDPPFLLFRQQHWSTQLPHRSHCCAGSGRMHLKLSENLFLNLHLHVHLDLHLYLCIYLYMYLYLYLYHHHTLWDAFKTV